MTGLESHDNKMCIAAIEAAMVGSIVGDALGVPVEFTSRSSLGESPVTGMRGFGTHNQPSGTWSDDSSLMLCLAESLVEKAVDYNDQGARFVSWMRDASWTPHGEVFDIGNATREAIVRLNAGIEPTKAGLAGESHCGNGSLMRILPVGLYLAFADRDERIEIAGACSRLTHGHPRCQLACIMFTEIVASLVRGRSFEEALIEGRGVLKKNLDGKFPKESVAFKRLLSPELTDLDEADVSSTGYVIHCLEASLWCAQRAGSFRAGLLAAVNLGDDTDTTGAVGGALLGLRFGIHQIPIDWINSLARLSDVRALIERFQSACLQRWRREK
jgi:ADP-ribosyl-[dinitrogen reductase] hydrolase